MRLQEKENEYWPGEYDLHLFSRIRSKNWVPLQVL